MRRNSRLSVALHVLLHMSEQRDQPMTSKQMAACAGANPVVIRRTFAGLREAGIVSSTKGHGGGWRIARPIEHISLGQIQDALDEHLVALAMADESPGCLVERAVNNALDEAVNEAERLMAQRLATISLARLAADVGRLKRASLSLSKDENHVA
jgi:Rrf2 family protein